MSTENRYFNVDSFIKQTARDYDLSYDSVRRVFYMFYDADLFYEKLEELLKEERK